MKAQKKVWPKGEFPFSPRSLDRLNGVAPSGWEYKETSRVVGGGLQEYIVLRPAGE